MGIPYPLFVIKLNRHKWLIFLLLHSSDDDIFTYFVKEKALVVLSQIVYLIISTNNINIATQFMNSMFCIVLTVKWFL